ncbi:MAG: hypothetical protein IIZ29_02865 [Schwartzia sp.]|nr:hypothetical protein [Schwartzia sp. (in: firmicutes)]MBQ2559430.1 hypothetical protein [Fibrobacter sp.]
MADEERDIYEDLTSYGTDGCSSVPISGVKVYDGKGYYVTVRLSDIRGSRIEECENPETCEPEMGLFIPFKHSGVTVTSKKNVQATYDMSMAQVPSTRHTHLLRQIVDRDVEEHWRKLGFHHAFDGFASPKGFKKRKK